MKELQLAFKDFSLVWLCLLVSCLIFVAFLQTTNVSVLLLITFAVVAFIYVFNRVEQIKFPIIRAFERRRAFALASILVAIVILPFILRSSPYWIFILTLAILWVIIAQGINIQFGSAGIINLGSAAFYGVGAYTAGMLATKLGVPPLLNLVFGAVMAMIVGSVLFIPVLKTRSYYLALVTIAFVMAFHTLINNAEWLGGAQGIVGIPLMSIGRYSFLQEINVLGFKLPSQANFYYLALVLEGLMALAAYRLWHSWVGLTWNSFNEDTGDALSAQCMGVAINKWSMIAFTIGNFYIGLAGAFYAHMTSYIAPPDITFYQSLLFLSAVILGGVDSILGVSVAAVLLVIMPEKLRALQQYWVIIFGIILVVMLILRREGLIPAKVRTYGLRVTHPTGDPSKRENRLENEPGR
jgi:branched-chain amino acid transport system permease protein